MRDLDLPPQRGDTCSVAGNTARTSLWVATYAPVAALVKTQWFALCGSAAGLDPVWLTGGRLEVDISGSAADGRCEVVIGLDRPGTEGNDIWAMKWQPGGWGHMNLSSHSFDADT